MPALPLLMNMDRISRAVLCVTVLFSLSHCVTSKPSSLRVGPEAIVLRDVPVERWGNNQCGAGALSTVLRHHGESVTEEELVPLLPVGRNQGVLSIDLLLAARQRGYRARLQRGSEERIRQSIEAGAPPILMIRIVDLPGKSRDLFHYIVVDGYDPRSGAFRTQFGDGEVRWVALSKLASQWSATDYAMLLIEPGSREEREGATLALRRAVVLEEQGRYEDAAGLSQAILREHPDLALAWLNLGNVQMKLQAFEDAEHSYREALRLAPEDRDVMNNLAWLLVTRNRNLEEAEWLARRASLEVGSDSFLYLDTLGRVLRARGNCEEAVDQFETALFAVPSEHQGYRASLLAGLGLARKDCDRDEEAKEALEEALSSNPEDPLRREIEAALEDLGS